MKLGEKVKVRMERLGMSQAELARASGLSKSYVSAIINDERGSRRTSVRLLNALKEGLRVEDDFFSH